MLVLTLCSDCRGTQWHGRARSFTHHERVCCTRGYDRTAHTRGGEGRHRFDLCARHAAVQCTSRVQSSPRPMPLPQVLSVTSARAHDVQRLVEAAVAKLRPADMPSPPAHVWFRDHAAKVAVQPPAQLLPTCGHATVHDGAAFRFKGGPLTYFALGAAAGLTAGLVLMTCRKR